MATQWLTAPVELTVSVNTTWTDIDVTANVSADATGIILLVYNNGPGDREFGVRKNGSTDTLPTTANTDIDNPVVTMLCVGIDASDIFEYYLEDSSNAQFWIVGYFEAEAVLFTNGVDKSTSTTGSYQDVDITADVTSGTAIAALVNIYDDSAVNSWIWLRKNGSTDSDSSGNMGHMTWLVGLDGSEIFEQQIENTTDNCVLIGYILQDWTVHTNSIILNIALANTWTIFTADAAATGVVARPEFDSGFSPGFGLRKSGGAWTLTTNPNRDTSFWAAACDASGQYEAISDSSSNEWEEVGFSVDPFELLLVAHSFTLTGNLPVIESGASVTTVAKAFSLSGNVPVITTGTTTDAGPSQAFTLTSNIPIIEAGESVVTVAKAFALVGNSPIIDTTTMVELIAQTFTLAGNVPSPQAGASVDTVLHTFSLASIAPSIDATEPSVAPPITAMVKRPGALMTRR